VHRYYFVNVSKQTSQRRVPAADLFTTIGGVAQKRKFCLNKCGFSWRTNEKETRDSTCVNFSTLIVNMMNIFVDDSRY